jgi:DNA-binding CsgD family transcriptional regulator
MKSFIPSMPVRLDSDHTATLSGLIDVVAEWVEALQGNASMPDAFARLITELGADAALLVRTHLKDMRVVRVHSCDPLGARFGITLDTSFADGCFGQAIMKPRPATVWISSSHAAGDTNANHAPLADWQARRRHQDFAVLVLTGGPVTRDHIELHFRRTPPLALQAAMGVVLPTIARAWASRRVGLVADLSTAPRAASRVDTKGNSSPALLSTANPSRLSRAEFRVCLLLSKGLTSGAVADELSLTDATVRSHLRSIYAKTGAGSLAELMFLLLAPQRAQSEQRRRCA